MPRASWHWQLPPVDRVDKIVGKEAFCEGCAYGWSKWKSHPSTGTITRCQLERVHIDLCGPIPNSFGGNKYFLLVINEHTHYSWVEFLPKKSDAFTRLKRWKLEAEQETDQKLQYLKSNGGKEFGSKEFKEWLTSEGVIHEMSAPYEHEQNGLAKRGIQNVLQWAMCQLFGANISQASGHMQLRMLSISSIVAQPPHSKIKKLHLKPGQGNVPISNIWWNRICTHPTRNPKKRTKKYHLCWLLGHTSWSKNYRLWDPEWCTIVISPNVDFNELPISHHANKT